MADRQIFRRGLNQEFVDHLNKVSGEGTRWWKEIVKASELCVGIRDNYLNVYFHGNSLLKLMYRPRSHMGKLTGETHRAYLQGDVPKTYAKSIDGTFIDDVTPKTLADFERLKAQALYHFGLDGEVTQSTREKTAIQHYLRDQEDIIDVEIAVSTSRYQNQSSLGLDRQTPRIDLAQLTSDGATAWLNFVEVKHVMNGELRARDEDRIKVVGQLRDYHRLLASADYRRAFLKSYMTICRNFAELGFDECRLMPLTKAVADEDLLLRINPKPKLLVLHGEGERMPRNWSDQELVLLRKLGDWCEYESVPLP